MASKPALSFEPSVQPSAALPGARAALLLLLLINLFNYIDRQILAAVIPKIKDTLFPVGAAGGGAAGDGSSLQLLLGWCQTHLGFTPKNALIGVLSMAFMVTYMIGAPVFGRLAERRSRWALISIGVVLWSLASGASGLAMTFGILLLTRCCVGIGEAAYGPVAPTLLSDFYPVKIRGQVLAWFYMAIPVGSALGYILGEQLAKSGIGLWSADVLGWRGESWRWAFYLVVPPGLLLGLWSFFMREPPRGQADMADPVPAHKASWRDVMILLRTPSYVLCTLGMAAMTFAIGGIAFWMPDYLETCRHLPGNPTSVFGAILVVAGLVGTLLGGVAGDKLRARFPGSYFLVSGAAMLLAFPLFLGVLKAPAPWIWVFIFLTCFCLFFNTGPSNTILANVAHPSIRATGFALNIFCIHALGDVISPVIIGILSDRLGDMNKAFLIVGFMCLLAGILWLWGARYLERDTNLAPTLLAASKRKGLYDNPNPAT
jgi:MFS transporter, Spinster family, sphingosine-1-phosphate transporter